MTLLVTALLSMGTSDTQQQTRLEIGVAEKPPRLDGRIGETEWDGAARVHGLKGDSGFLAADLFFEADGETLYVALNVPISDGLLIRAAPDPHHDTLAGLDDSWELWLVPRSRSCRGDAFRIVFNAAGAIWDARYTQSGKTVDADVKWTAGAKIVSRIEADAWEAEIAVPQQALCGVEARSWSIRVIRQERKPSRSFTWPETARPDAPLVAMAQIALVRNAVVGRLWPGPEAWRLEVKNLLTTPRDVRVELLGADERCTGIGDRTVLLDGETRKTLTVPANCAGARPWVRILDREGERVHFAQRIVAGIGSDEEPTVDISNLRLDVAHYPYGRKLRLRLSGIFPTSMKLPLRAQMKFIAEANSALLLSKPLSLREEGNEWVFDLPELQDGQYRVSVHIEDEATGAVLESSFRHETFGWEHNTLGIPDSVIPPFTPLHVRDKTVTAVLREHEMNGVGLWSSVRAAGKELLAGPMSLRVKVDGKIYTARAQAGPRFTIQKPHEVRYEASWRAGGLRGVTAGVYEMDGMLQVELKLPEQPSILLEELELVLPLREDVAHLINVVTDRLRHNESALLPGGTGHLWDSTQARRVDLQDPFVPYLWLGDETRGLAWFASNFDQWVVQGDAAPQRLERNGDAVVLHVRFVGGPVPLDRDRSFAFGLQATPTKPLPASPDWRQWQPRCSRQPGQYALCILASSWQWGGATTFGSVRSMAGDIEILKQLAAARRLGSFDPATVQAWYGRHAQEVHRPEAWRRNLEYGFRALSHQPDAVVAYVNGRYLAQSAETDVYSDEWSPNPYGPPAGSLPPGELLSTFPTRSWQDFVLWHVKGLLDKGVADGFYIDNTFLRAIFDDIAGPASRDRKGRIHPGVDLFEMREFLMRLQVLSFQARGRWLDVSHMTNTPIAPVQTWSAAILDGELRYGSKPFQERFSRDWLRAEALGTQTGSVPLFLPGIQGTLSENEREALMRSAVGAAAVHEIRLWGAPKKLVDEIWGGLYRFGYGAPDSRVFRYWDLPAVAGVSGVDAEVLVLARDAEALALVASFGESGSAELRLDGDRLGLPAHGTCQIVGSNRDASGSEPFTCRFSLPRYGYRLLRYGYRLLRFGED